MAIKVVIVDDHPIIRDGIRQFLAKSAVIEVMAEASNGEEALKLVDEIKPDVLVLDMELPDINGVEVTRRMKASGTSTRVLAFSGHLDGEYVLGVLEAGAAGYLTKDETYSSIVDAVQGVASGQEGWLSRGVREKVFSAFSGDSPQEYRMTAREVQVSELVVKGKTNQQIAEILGLSEKTVEKYLQRLFRKVGVSSRVELAVLVMRKEMKDSDPTPVG